MPKETISFKDATVTVHAGLTGSIKIDVDCRSLVREGLTPTEFAELIYPAIDAAASAAPPAPESA
jgi:hypothetical protein